MRQLNRDLKEYAVSYLKTEGTRQKKEQAQRLWGTDMLGISEGERKRVVSMQKVAREHLEDEVRDRSEWRGPCEPS